MDSLGISNFPHGGAEGPKIIDTQLAYDVVTTLGFRCFLVATSDNVVTTLSQHCVSDIVTTTKN